LYKRCHVTPCDRAIVHAIDHAIVDPIPTCCANRYRVAIQNGIHEPIACVGEAGKSLDEGIRTFKIVPRFCARVTASALVSDFLLSLLDHAGCDVGFLNMPVYLQSGRIGQFSVARGAMKTPLSGRSLTYGSSEVLFVSFSRSMTSRCRSEHHLIATIPTPFLASSTALRRA